MQKMSTAARVDMKAARTEPAPAIAQRSRVVHAKAEIKLLPRVRRVAGADQQRRAVEVARRAVHVAGV